jgi:[ribosomal protein S18]-alanine N-acetyltransferase
MSELYFQPVCQDDYKEIMALEYASFNGRDRMKPEVFYDFINNPSKKFIKVVDKDSNLIACIMLCLLRNREGVDSGYIYSIAVNEKYKRKGIASICMQHIIEYFIGENASFIELHVRKSNIPAIKLYEKFDFFIDQIVDNYYEDGDDALIFQKLL